MKSKAIIGQTPDVYYLDKDILNFLNYTYIPKGCVLIGVGHRYRFDNAFDVVEIDGVEYNWDSGGVFPMTPVHLLTMQLDGFDSRQKDTLIKLINGTYICALSEYKRNEESYQRRMREKKLQRIIK